MIFGNKYAFLGNFVFAVPQFNLSSRHKYCKVQLFIDFAAERRNLHCKWAFFFTCNRNFSCFSVFWIRNKCCGCVCVVCLNCNKQTVVTIGAFLLYGNVYIHYLIYVNIKNCVIADHIAVAVKCVDSLSGIFNISVYNREILFDYSREIQRFVEVKGYISLVARIFVIGIS